MKRKLLMSWLGGMALSVAGLLTLPQAHAQPSYTVSLQQMQDAVSQRFPMRYPVGGLLDLNLQAPSLRLLPDQNRLGAAMVVDAAGPALASSTTGYFDLDFALRYEASDQSIRAHQLRVNLLRLSGLPPGPSALLQAYGPSLANQTLQDVVVYRLRPQDLTLADGLGLEPSTITVTTNGLRIGFIAKPQR